MPHAAIGHRNKSVDLSHFAMIPRPDVPRSVFQSSWSHKTTFDTGILIPVYVDEVLPGDSFRLQATLFARLSTPVFPVMDDLFLDSFFFFVPNRLLWQNWQRFMGERDPAPDSSISYTIPQVVSTGNGFGAFSLGDYFGLPIAGLKPTAPISVSALPFRAYALVYKEWFRDENLIAADAIPLGDGPDAEADYALKYRAKVHDYFTSCLPWPQKGSAAAQVPLTGTAPVIGIGTTGAPPTTGASYYETGGALVAYPWNFAPSTVGSVGIRAETNSSTAGPSIYADLSVATAVTINALRLAVQTQVMLERDARGGTRYTEIIRSHFGVISPDSRLQRPEYLGGSSQRLGLTPVAQTSATGLTGGSAPLGNLGAVGTFVASPGFHQSFTEHGVVIGLVQVRGVQSYQQGVRRMWDRQTRFDFYWPAFANLGEQAVTNRELYAVGTGSDAIVFGYQERWAEYRYRPSLISGFFRSGVAGTLDSWHFAQEYSSPPTLSEAFVNEDLPMARVLAAGSAAAGQEVLFDSLFQLQATRPIPAWSVPALGGRF